MRWFAGHASWTLLRSCVSGEAEVSGNTPSSFLEKNVDAVRRPGSDPVASALTSA
ncbi:hypothetical protein ATKI12_1656 [Kitasatospora sp. Ki12]